MPSTVPNAGIAQQSVTYTPTATVNYNTASGTVSVSVSKKSADRTVANTIGIQNNADGTVTITFGGTPDAQYVVQASDNLAVPAWENVSTNTAGTDGYWTFTESTEPHPQRFYRLAKP